MKLGVSYNVFDGEELLESSIKSIRDNVDHISVVYQTISNFGNDFLRVRSAPTIWLWILMNFILINNSNTLKK